MSRRGIACVFTKLVQSSNGVSSPFYDGRPGFASNFCQLINDKAALSLPLAVRRLARTLAFLCPFEAKPLLVAAQLQRRHCKRLALGIHRDNREIAAIRMARCVLLDIFLPYGGGATIDSGSGGRVDS